MDRERSKSIEEKILEWRFRKSQRMVRFSTFFVHVFDVVNKRKDVLKTFAEEMHNITGFSRCEETYFRQKYDYHLISNE